MKKNLIWAGIFSLAVLVSLAVIFFGQLLGEKPCAEIYVGGELYKVVDDLDTKQLRSFKVETEHGYNIISYQSGKIWVSESDCANQTCVKYAKASLAGENIICAPHKLVIKIVGKDDKKVDAAA